MVRRFALVLIFISISFVAAGGDIAVFENLGFSGDSAVFLFGQYGINAEDGLPFAEIYAVDVDRNSFVSDGVLTSGSPGGERPLSLGQDGRGALFHLIGDARRIVDRYEIDHLNNGRLIYILVDGEDPKSRIAFRDFNTSRRYEFELNQKQRTDGETTEAAFGIRLTVTNPDDSTTVLSMGRPDYYRDGVANYRITQVLLGPSERSIVVVVEKLYEDESVRYMVETASF